MPKRYSGEYKQAAIQDCQNGIPIDEVSQTRGIAVSTIYRWLKDCAEEILIHTTQPCFAKRSIWSMYWK